jgi:hypothetical protein
MSASTSVYTTPVFWERLWRMSGINFVVFFLIAYVIYGYQPQVGASADALVAFYQGDRTRVLIAAVFSGIAVLNLLWFAAALRTTLADAGQDGWGAATTASSAAVGALFLLLITVGAALAYSIASSENHTLTSGLNDFAWAGVVLTSFPRAMLIMAGRQYLDFLTATLFPAPAYNIYGALIAEGKFEPAAFAAPLGHKDIRLTLAAGESFRVPMPLASLLHDRFLALLAQGGEALDWSAIGGLATKDAGHQP